MNVHKFTQRQHAYTYSFKKRFFFKSKNVKHGVQKGSFRNELPMLDVEADIFHSNILEVETGR